MENFFFPSEKKWIKTAVCPLQSRRGGGGGGREGGERPGRERSPSESSLPPRGGVVGCCCTPWGAPTSLNPCFHLTNTCRGERRFQTNDHNTSVKVQCVKFAFNYIWTLLKAARAAHEAANKRVRYEEGWFVFLPYRATRASLLLSCHLAQLLLTETATNTLAARRKLFPRQHNNILDFIHNVFVTKS